MIEYWMLFSESWIAGWLISALFGLLGVFLIAGDRAFFGAVLAQASAFGAVLAGTIGVLSPVAAAVLVNLIVVAHLGRGRSDGTVVAAWFVLLGCGTITIAAGNPRGMEDAHRAMTSSLLGATSTDGLRLLVLSLVLVPVACMIWKRILFCVVDRDAASVQGLRPGLVLIGLYAAWAGMMGVGVPAAGVLFCLGMLVFPGMFARRVCRRFVPVLWVAPLAAVAATTAAYALSVNWDLPPGPLAVLVIAAATALAHATPRRAG